MPGRHEVAVEFGVSPQTAQAALALLEREGLLVSQGSGRPRRIVRQKVAASGGPLLRVAILVAEASDRQTNNMQEDFLPACKHLRNSPIPETDAPNATTSARCFSLPWPQ
jgi:DNA-binding transcriptional regulator YhcF (GntR family)